MANNNDLFKDVIEKQTFTYEHNKATLVDYYQRTHGKNWKSDLAMKMSGTDDKKSTAYRSAMRHFQGSRLEKEGRDKNRWEKLGGELLPSGRIPRNGTLSFTIEGKQHDPYGGTRDRTINYTMKGASAFDFANNPNWIDFWDDYDIDSDLMEDGDYELEVTSVT